MRDLAERSGLDLARCAAYSDSANDLPLLGLVGSPSAVNPDRALRRHAATHGCPSTSSARGSTSPAGRSAPVEWPRAPWSWPAWSAAGEETGAVMHTTPENAQVGGTDGRDSGVPRLRALAATVGPKLGVAAAVTALVAGAATAVTTLDTPSAAAATALCDQYAKTTTADGKYRIQNNRWGTSAQQCIEPRRRVSA